MCDKCGPKKQKGKKIKEKKKRERKIRAPDSLQFAKWISFQPIEA